ncbi:MAG: NAD(+) synthase [Deltaproteobacteria bacterium]|nr:NAD(+) synthase [Deltaproteobacteria bacterium]TLN01829.1 MAG: NAD(+) synthase [bacterium]
MSQKQFLNLYTHNFIRTAVILPKLKVADPEFNSRETIRLLRQAQENNALLAAFPELGLSAYSCDDLFHQQALLDGCLAGLATILDESKSIPIIGIVGLPLRIDSLLFNCAVVFYRGKVLGITPKTYLPNYREFYELRQFSPADHSLRDTIDLLGQSDIPFGNKLLFQVENQPLLTFTIEVCEDVWVPIPPSSYAALAGATVIVNLSASNITVGKADYRRQLVSNQSGRCLAAYLYSAAGLGESSTDLAWDGHGMIYENGSQVAESKRFCYEDQIVYGDLDLDRLVQERMRQNSFGQSIQRFRDSLQSFRTISFAADLPSAEKIPLERRYERFPFVPSDPARRDERCREVYEIQVQALVKRFRSSGADKMVIGISGGLDSTQALIVCARAMDVMGLSRFHILAYTMPGFATSQRTLEQARRLIRTVGCTYREIDIRPSCHQMLKDIGHPFHEGQPVYDVTFENVQAGERTSHLFRLANQYGGIVVGTSDLSEMALGWCTYGVGDHMAHYHVNASVPKTLIQYLIRWTALTDQLGSEVSPVLNDILETEISPELVPGDDTSGQPVQRTEDIVGPYELQDFTLYYTLRLGYLPAKVAFMAWSAWHDKKIPGWPDIPEPKQHEYTLHDIKKWLKVFLWRFFKTSQFKRTCVPNSPKVGSGGSLSPRGDWRAPSDGEATAFVAELDRIPD